MAGPGDFGPVRDERAHNQNGPIFSDRDFRQRRADDLWVGLGIHLPPASENGGPKVATGHHPHGHRRRRRHHRHRAPRSGADGITADTAADLNHKDSLGPTQRVQFLLHHADDEVADPIETHRLFTEMEELQGEEWRETARWIRFEEDVEEGGNRWSKPHVATLSLHSLFELRSCISKGSVILDMEAADLSQAIEILLDKMIANKRLEEDKRELVRNTLLRKHTHQYEHMRGTAHAPKTSEGSQGGGFLSTVRSLADMGKSFSHGKNLFSHGSEPDHTEAAIKKASAPMGPQLTLPQPSSVPKNLSQTELTAQPSDVSLKKTPLPLSRTRRRSQSAVFSGEDVHKKRSVAFSFGSPKLSRRYLLYPRPSEESFGSTGTFKGNQHFMKKIPPGAEASNVLVGEVDFLEHPIAAFIRVQNAIILGDLTEVPVPTRFLFIILGPSGYGPKYREIGRAMATLMSDEVFHDVAYKAHDRNDLLDGVDEFLDQVTVLPPGEWDPDIRIEPPSHIPSQEKRRQMDKDPEAGGGGKGGGHGGDDDEEEEGGHAADPALKRTGRLFGGLIADIRRKLPWYPSDFRDAVSIQCVASFFFMYFAILAPIVTFGGLLEEETGGYMAAMENLLSGAICGSIFCLFSGQPLTIIGSTGPVLVFESIVYSVSTSMNLEYMPVRLWIGIWTFIILFIMVMTDASALVTYITRFTEESFACLISLIFIVKAFKKLFSVLSVAPYTIFPDINKPPPNSTCLCQSGGKVPEMKVLKKVVNKFKLGNLANITWLTESIGDDGKLTYNVKWDETPLTYCPRLGGTLFGHNCYEMYDIFLMSLVLMMGTFTLAYVFKLLRTSRYFPSKVRQIFSDFAVMLSIVIMVLVDFVIGLNTPKLYVPSEFRPTSSHLRGWLIPFFGTNPWWTVLLAIPPALLACILIFMDQQITAVIVNRRENKLKKGCGYHLDLFVLSILILVCSFLGLPYYVAATVLSVTHVNSLRVESQCKAPGEIPSFIGCREQRLTGFFVFFFIGLSVLMTSFLQLIPMPVLYGVFLYMGVSSLKGVQLVDRLLLFFMPMKYQPDYIYLRHVPIKRVHLFTAFQGGCLALLWVVKAIKKTSIAFPLMLVFMVGVRYLLKFVFTSSELNYLDDKMPEITLRKRDDAKKAKEAKDKGDGDGGPDEGGGEEADMVGGLQPVKTEHNIHIPLASGNVMKIPLQKPLDISEELTHSDLWKHIESEPSLACGPNGPPPPYSHGPKKHHHHRDHGSSKSSNKAAPRVSPEKDFDGILQSGSDLHAQKRSTGDRRGSNDEDQPITINVERPSPIPSPIPSDREEAEVPLLPRSAKHDENHTDDNKTAGSSV